MTIREATGVDLAAIDDIYNHYVQTSTSTFQVDPTTPEERRAWFAAHGPDHPVLVFEEDEETARRDGPRVAGGRIAGWASLSQYCPREAYGRTVELSVYVRHDRHRRGVGRALAGRHPARPLAWGCVRAVRSPVTRSRASRQPTCTPRIVPHHELT
jgi:L-amino acid N-acyltransferase YncA